MHYGLLEALERTLKDIHGNKNIFNSAMIFLSCDFRQTIPIILRSFVADELNACLKSLNMWWHINNVQLTTNMRVFLQENQTAIFFSK
jgi:ATP-dependent DNA helicase PIF1